MPDASHPTAPRATAPRATAPRATAFLCTAALACLFALAAFLFAPRAASADEAAKARALVDKATQTIEDFKADPDMTWFRDNLPDAKAIMVVPVLVKAGFIFGGSGGHGLILWRDERTGAWGYPSFTFMGSATFGLQIGAEVAEVVLIIRSERGKRALLSTEFKLGGDVSVAAGPTGVGAQAATTDVLAFSRAKGLFGGLTVEGAVIEPRAKWNAAYYGKAVTPEDILIERSVRNAQADPLRRAVARARADAAPTTPAAATQAPATQAPAAPAAQAYDLTIVQAALAAKGYDPGPIDGKMGAKTRAAIRRYQSDTGFEVTGNPSAALQRSLTGG